MRWKSGRRSTNVEDRRTEQASSGRANRGFRIGGGKKGGIGIIVVAVVVMLLGGDPSTILNMLLGGSGVPTQTHSQTTERNYQTSAPTDEMADFVSVVLADTEDTWNPLFQKMGEQYQKPRLVLFRGSVKSACGMAQSAMGPFYCPGDQKVYIDLSFYEELKHAFGAPGDFAQAYVIAHEVGHHVQQQFGILQKVHKMQRGMPKPQANVLSVKLELQADCLAGIWAHHANRVRNIVEPGDIDEAMNAASKIGDDAIQKRTQGYVVPDSFTHGTSAQRVKWFNVGFTRGDVQSCNTFG
ncbi:neutral zinc metallopeptidase [Neptunomonas sp.]|uniref:KPN_02809 family neutral zinc metallopeptidase n=1 Tax=Neptunomonas sp. TaxID=1971898 RepID=UPI0025EE6AD0|nr:neutral zinc metallopeptidase [Neptunomonas sp.]